MEGFVKQATGTLKFEDDLRTVVLQALEAAGAIEVTTLST